ncbi:MAG: outer membrane protein assembly factor BamA [Desulfobacterales bacterium]
MIVPFEIHAEYDRNYLQEEISGIISDHIKKSGARIIPSAMLPEDSNFKEPENVDAIRSLGSNIGASYIIWGSSTWIGDQYEIKAKILETGASNDPRVFFSKGQGLENLLPSVQDISRSLASAIMKQEEIVEIKILGNKRIEADAIKRKIKTEVGDVFLAERLSDDLVNVYSMGYFDDIRIESEDTARGKVVIFHIQEKPTIKEILITGNKENAYDDEEIKENMGIKTGSIFNVFKIKRELKKIELMFKEKNYHNAGVAYKIEPLENNQANLEIIIEEGEEILVQKIIFEGNQTYSEDELKELTPAAPGILGWWPISYITEDSEMGEMDTTEEGFFSFLTGSGELNLETLSNDTAKLNAFYQNHGFIQVRIGEPEIDYQEDGIYIRIKINEGPRFKVGKIDLSGDMIQPKTELMEKLKIGHEEFMNMGLLREDILALTDIYADKGFFYADIYPRLDKDLDNLLANITFVIKKGKPVYFEKIIISGNVSTRDKVIRRELPFVEQDLYSSSKLKRGVRNLHRLDFFEEVKVNNLKGSADDKMILKIDATDKPTGAFTFGMGYSSIENVFASVSVTERNLFGRGQIVSLSAEVGGTTKQYSVSFTEPWLFDIPLSASVALFNTTSDYDDYDRERRGASVGLGYPVFDYTRLSVSYVYELNEISNIETFASDNLFLLEGENLTSKMISKLHYDSRDKVINPTEGQDHSITVTYAGDPLGGDIAFIKYILETGVYIPLFWGTVGFMHGEGGNVREHGDGLLPSYERFFLGGINSLRGFEWRGIPEERYNSSGQLALIGGSNYVQFNFEFIFPILRKAGIMGVFFYDTGNAFFEDETINLGNLRESAGYGIRWYSPMGPIRIERGHILDRREGEGDGRWEFTMGGAF